MAELLRAEKESNLNPIFQRDAQIRNATFRLTEPLFIPANWAVDFRNCVFEFVVPLDVVNIDRIERDLALQRLVYEIIDEREE